MFLPEGAQDSAVSWRGPMLHRALEQFLTDVFFGDLDVLLVDMPPGTGDVSISVGQVLPQAEVIVVTTPQSAASGVAIRSGSLARQLKQRVVGVVEPCLPCSSKTADILNRSAPGVGRWSHRSCPRQAIESTSSHRSPSAQRSAPAAMPVFP